MTKKTGKTAAGIGDEAVKSATGKSWSEWFKLLDMAGAGKMDHRAIATLMSDELKCPPWWSQMVTVAYEQERGLREKHQSPDGYKISVSRTLTATAAALDKAWRDQRVREGWLSESIEIRKATPKKSMRITWKDGKTSVDVNFYPKAGKCQVVVQHTKLADKKSAEKMKLFWGDKLDALKDVVERKR